MQSILAITVHKRSWPEFYQYFYIPKRFKGYNWEVIKLNNEDVTWHDGVNWDSIGFCIHGWLPPWKLITLRGSDFTISKVLRFLKLKIPNSVDFDDVWDIETEVKLHVTWKLLIPILLNTEPKLGKCFFWEMLKLAFVDDDYLQKKKTNLN